MTPADEHLLALAKIICTAMTGPSDFGWADQSDQYRAKCMDAALRAIVAERQAIRDRALEEAAMVASQDCDWSAFGKRQIEQWDGGPDAARDYRIGLASGQAISAAIRAMKGGAG